MALNAFTEPWKSVPCFLYFGTIAPIKANQRHKKKHHETTGWSAFTKKKINIKPWQHEFFSAFSYFFFCLAKEDGFMDSWQKDIKHIPHISYILAPAYIVISFKYYWQFWKQINCDLWMELVHNKTFRLQEFSPVYFNFVSFFFVNSYLID